MAVAVSNRPGIDFRRLDMPGEFPPQNQLSWLMRALAGYDDVWNRLRANLDRLYSESIENDEEPPEATRDAAERLFENAKAALPNIGDAMVNPAMSFSFRSDGGVELVLVDWSVPGRLTLVKHPGRPVQRFINGTLTPTDRLSYMRLGAAIS